MRALQVLLMCFVAANCAAFALHGLFGGIIRRKVIKNLTTREYAVGPDARARGIIYLIFGSLGFIGAAAGAILLASQ